MGEGESLEALSKRFDMELELLEERNDFTDTDKIPETGDLIKIVIPSLMENKLPYPIETVEFDPESHPYFDLLARIIQVEAGYEKYEGQLAVGSVIMNRVHSERFPNSIYEVVYAPGQFPPAHNGLLDRSVPNESVLKATKAVLNGVNNVEGALFFHNPKVSGGGFWNSLKLIDEIGGHRFLK